MPEGYAFNEVAISHLRLLKNLLYADRTHFTRLPFFRV